MWFDKKKEFHRHASTTRKNIKIACVHQERNTIVICPAYSLSLFKRSDPTGGSRKKMSNWMAKKTRQINSFKLKRVQTSLLKNIHDRLKTLKFVFNE